MEPLRVIGYWRNEQHPEYPDPRDFVDETWNEESRDTVAMYLDGGYMPWSYGGLSLCRICGEPNGSCEYADGVFTWPQGLAHYIREHSVRLPASVEQHVFDQMERYEDVAQRDLDWWVNTTVKNREEKQ